MSPSFGTGFGFVNPLCDHVCAARRVWSVVGTQRVLLIDGCVGGPCRRKRELANFRKELGFWTKFWEEEDLFLIFKKFDWDTGFAGEWWKIM